MNKMKTMNQVYCAAVTPFQKNYEIDYQGFKENLQWYLRNGLAGVLVCGGTGEFVSLSTQERMELVEFAAKEINGTMGFMVGCAAETTAEAILHAQHAEKNGADGLLLIASYYFKPSEEESYQHFRAVAESVNIPIVLYNNPGSCGTDLQPEFVKRLSEIPNIKHLKEATGDLLRFKELRHVCGDGFSAVCGCDALAFELFKNGASGWISITANALPSQSQEIFDTMQRKEEGRAWDVFQKYLQIYTLCEKPYKAIQTVKYIMDKLGCCGGHSRLPRLPLTTEEKIVADQMMVEAGLISF